MKKWMMICFLLVFAWPVGAQGEVSADQVNEVAQDMYCPVCESEPLDTCATQACQDWRDEIRVQLSLGKTKEEIHADFRTRYGDRVLANPPAEGLNLLLWLGLPIGLIVGGYFFSRYLRDIRQTQPATSDKPLATTKPDDEYIQRIEEELKK